MTDLVYWSDTYQFETTAKVVELISLPNNDFVLILDRTIFYPQGGINTVTIYVYFEKGGQPSDQGTIKTDGETFVVNDVRLKDSMVHHTGKFQNENGQDKFKPDTPVQLSINKEKRVLHARLHSAGHLLGNTISFII